MAPRGRKKEAASPFPLDVREMARRAYLRFESRGCVHGRDVEDWLEAEREMRAELAAGADSKVRVLKPGPKTRSKRMSETSAPRA